MSDSHEPREFLTTHWSLVVASHGAASPSRARRALEELCRTYWYPLYAFVRYRGYSADDAQDLTQSFFARTLETGGFGAADPERGRFRSYLLGAMKHFLANEWHRARTRKRGGGVTFLELDAEAHVDPTGLPQHARPLLRNLGARKFEKLSFLTGTLRGVLDQPAEVGRGIRAASLFVLPLYTWVLVFVGSYRGAEWLYELVGESAERIALAAAVAVLLCFALARLLQLPFRTTASHATFRLAVVDTDGEPADARTRLVRWAFAWLPLLVPLTLLLLLGDWRGTAVFAGTLAVLLLWIGAAAHAALHPHRGLHDRLARTWVVRS